jgi:hypothetical protein
VFGIGLVIFFCVGVMYSGEYDVCDVTLSVYPHSVSTSGKLERYVSKTVALLRFVTPAEASEITSSIHRHPGLTLS